MSPEDVAAVVREYGADWIMVDTDCANVLWTDVFSLKRAIIKLYRLGLSEDNIRKIMLKNPSAVFGLDERGSFRSALVRTTADFMSCCGIRERMSDLLAGKTAIVTGGASGIGRGIALELVSHGADIVVAELQETPQTPETTPTLEAIDEHTDSRSLFVECDVTSYDDLTDAVDAAEELGGIDVMVNNAEIVHPVDFFETTDEDFDTLVDVNLKGHTSGVRPRASGCWSQAAGQSSTSPAPPRTRGSWNPGQYSTVRRRAA